MKNFFLNYWRTILVVICILFLSFAPPSDFQGIPTFDNEDKLVHLLMYAGLTSMLIFDFRVAVLNFNLKSFRFIFFCLVFPTLLGGIIEILQPLYFAPRSASWFDFLFDFFGVIIGLIFMNVFKNIVTKIFYSKKN
jgi:VanZ family protein